MEMYAEETGAILRYGEENEEEEKNPVLLLKINIYDGEICCMASTECHFICMARDTRCMEAPYLLPPIFFLPLSRDHNSEKNFSLPAHKGIFSSPPVARPWLHTRAAREMVGAVIIMRYKIQTLRGIMEASGI